MSRLSLRITLLFAAASVLASCSERRSDSALDGNNDWEAPKLVGFEFADSSGVVTWTTDEPARVVIEYGDAGELNRHTYPAHRLFERSGRVTLVDVAPMTTYACSVRTWDQVGNEARYAVDDLVTGAVPVEPTFLLAMIDVGWGDSIYLEAPDGTNVLIDAGHPKDGRIVRQFLENRLAELRLNFASLSHVHGDHIGGFFGDSFAGLDGLIADQGGGSQRFYIETFLDISDKTAVNGPYGDLEAALAGLAADDSLGIHVRLEYGESSATTEHLQWGEGVRVDLLAAGRKPYINLDFTLQDNGGSVLNNDSMVYRVQYGQFVALLMGDGEFAAEQFLQDRYSQGFAQATVLKLGHHGSDDASSERFIDFVQPIVGLITNAITENPGVQHPFVLNRLRNRSIDYYASDRAIPNLERSAPGVRGDILVHTDGEFFTVVAENIRYE